MLEPGNILIVDDEENIRLGLRAILTKDGHTIQDVESAEAAIDLLTDAATASVVETAVIDIRLPGMKGVELLAIIKQRWPHIAVILLTGHGTLETAMSAIKEGAHDYLLKPAKPAALREAICDALTASRRNREQSFLINTLRSGLQRLEQLPSAEGETAPLTSDPTLKIGNLSIDQQAHEITCQGTAVSLTPSEYKLLITLATCSGSVMSYVALVEKALDYEAEAWEAKELIKRHIFTLRHKIEPDPAKPQYILNVRGVGYRFRR